MAKNPVRPRATSDTFLRDAESARAVRDKLRFLLDYGVLAQAGHPWVIHVGDDALELRLGHRCDRAAHDRHHRDVILGCGIGLAQLRLALRQLGCIDSTIPLPDDARPDLLARVYIDHVEETADPPSFVLYQALTAPISTVPPPIQAAFQQELMAQAQHERAILSFTTPASTPGGEVTAACGAPTLASVVGRLAWMDAAAHEGAVVGAVIATRGDSPSDWLAAGQALARVVLRARAEGYSSHVERAARGTRLSGGTYGQVVVRVGVPRRAAYGGGPTTPTGPGFGPGPGPGFESGSGSGRGPLFR